MIFNDDIFDSQRQSENLLTRYIIKSDALKPNQVEKVKPFYYVLKHVWIFVWYGCMYEINEVIIYSGVKMW